MDSELSPNPRIITLHAHVRALPTAAAAVIPTNRSSRCYAYQYGAPAHRPARECNRLGLTYELRTVTLAMLDTPDQKRAGFCLTRHGSTRGSAQRG
jgi:hypothetical protein